MLYSRLDGSNRKRRKCVGLRCRVNGVKVEQELLEDFFPKRPTIPKTKEKLKSIKIPSGGVVLLFPDGDEEVKNNKRHFLRLVCSKGVRAHLDSGKVVVGSLVDKKFFGQVVGFSASDGGNVYLYFSGEADIK